MKLTNLLILIFSLSITNSSIGQNTYSYQNCNTCAYTTCQGALNNLYTYANQVQGAYNTYANWINYNIHPYYRQSYFNSLNYWYQQQAQYVSATYYGIVSNCTSSPNRTNDQTVLSPYPNSQNTSIANQERTRLSNEDAGKRIRIEIPDNPVGWTHQ